MPELRVTFWWRNPHWKDELARMPPHHRLELENGLLALGRALQETEHPLSDPALAPWSPKPWHVPFRKQTLGTWVEYRLGDSENRGRVIVCHDETEDTIYLVARTPVHDMECLRELSRLFKP